jgi:hypothetical protein
MMERVITQTDWRPDWGEAVRRRHIDRIEILLCYTHHLAVIFPAMRDQCAQLIGDCKPDMHS